MKEHSHGNKHGKSSSNRGEPSGAHKACGDRVHTPLECDDVEIDDDHLLMLIAMTRRQRHEDDDHRHRVLVIVIVSGMATAIKIEGN